ncbi:MAG: mechanosensitive ion channel [Candidatus Bathyarchaeia archaeon]
MLKAILHYFYQEKIAKAILYIALAIAAYFASKQILQRYLQRYAGFQVADRSIKQRMKTLEKLFFSTVKLLLTFWLIFSFLDLLGLDVKALALSAGVAGLAISFGAQSLVKDLIGGFLILIEGQFDLGDFVKIGDTEGVVFSMGSRFVTLVNKEHALVQIPFGSITNIVNYRQVQEKECQKHLKSLINKIQSQALKKGVLFRTASYTRDGELIAAFYFYSTPVKKEFVEYAVKAIREAGFEPETVSQANASLITFEIKKSPENEPLQLEK